MRVCAGLLVLVLATSACSDDDSPRRERRHRDRGQASTPQDDIRAVIEMNQADAVGRREVHETLGDFEDMLR